jgi:hypothetical protein
MVWLLVSKLTTRVISQALKLETIFFYKGVFLIEPMLILHSWGQVM